MNVNVIDNFLDVNVFQTLQKEIYGPNLPWFHQSTTVYDWENSKFAQNQNNPNDWQLTHTFYKHNLPRSDKFYLLTPLLEKLNPSALLKAKANLVPKTENIFIQPMHIDISMFKGKTSVYYINSNDGFTVFEDGTKIESIANRMIIFDSTIKHAGTTCTNTRNRCVINFNFYEWELT